MRKKKKYRRERRQLLAVLIEQQKTDMFFDARQSIYGMNRRLKKV